MLRKKKIIIRLIIFTAVFLLHMLYFKSKAICEEGPWLLKYLKEQEYFLGASYALSFSFMAFALLKFRENRKVALKAAFSSGVFTVLLLFFCFFLGCCSSPMLIVYLNLFGLSHLKAPKWLLFLTTIIFVGIGYLWMLKKSKGPCCAGLPENKRHTDEKI